MTASTLLRTGVAFAHRAAKGGASQVRHMLTVTYQRIAIWLAMMAMVGISGLAIALGLNLIRFMLPWAQQILHGRQAA